MKSNYDLFCEEYERQLAIAVAEHPGEYLFKQDRVSFVAGKMATAFKTGSYNKDGRAVKQTCKVLNIPYTYAGINQFLEQK
jgi:hypothetical protein